MRSDYVATMLGGVAIVLAASVPGMSETVSAVSKNGFTWYFTEPAEVGQYANGDYWVVGPVTIDSITPRFDGSSYGWEVNPVATGGQGFGRLCGGFDSTLVPREPYNAQPGESILKTAPTGENRPCIKTAAVLTVVGEVPSDSGTTVFRPPYAGSTKPMYSTTGLRTDLLPSYEPVGDVETLAKIEKRYGDVRIEHKDGLLGRGLHPADYMDDYGADIGYHNAEACGRFMLDSPLDSIYDALIDYVQYGIDLYHIIQLGVKWNNGGGHRPGMKLPIVFASVMLDNQDMKTDIAARTTFNEDLGISIGSQAGVPLFGFASSGEAERAYWEALVTEKAGDPQGNKSLRDPYGYIDGGSKPGSFDQYCCTSQPWKNVVACLYFMPALREVYSDAKLFAYVDRWVTEGAWTQPDPCAPPETTMDGYGLRFGADPDNPGDCIRDTDPSDGIGRFPNLHGSNADGGHRRSPFFGDMWDAYRSDVGTTERIAVAAGKDKLTVQRQASHLVVRTGAFPDGGTIMLYDTRGRAVGRADIVKGAIRHTIALPKHHAAQVLIVTLQNGTRIESAKVTMD